MKKRLLIVVLSALFVIVLFVIFNVIGKAESADSDTDALKKELLLSFIDRQTIRTIQEPSTLSDIDNRKDVVPDNCLVYFVNAGCSFCIGELLSNMSMIEDLYLNEKILYAANDTMTLSFYLETVGYEGYRLLLTSKADNDSITNMNGRIYKIRNGKTVDMIDLNNLFN